jgi:hypothetical protein
MEPPLLLESLLAATSARLSVDCDMLHDGEGVGESSGVVSSRFFFGGGATIVGRRSDALPLGIRDTWRLHGACGVRVRWESPATRDRSWLPAHDNQRGPGLGYLPLDFWGGGCRPNGLS